ncbi:restriction endonuclease [Rhizobium sp. B230/85]|uniref:restriction endonuclease n=1 Tax=unclassified Rhizobium TaxID=2613769 RepID=UPI001AD99C06|nr:MULTISPECIES: restriction endonuclease [unclassified Rhizobium]MBO9136454.1 restriction endonuclease [Rhizobium sp. B209b/85]QXZ98654.1 restriction endonuclease [Rhizobium sp. B230/85]
MTDISELVKDWGGFEKLVASLHETGDVTVEHNVILKGRSCAERQFDVLVRHRKGFYEHLIVVECKYWNKNVARLHVDALATTIREVGATKGVIFSTKGFQSGAIEQAAHEQISLFQVRDLTDEEWGLPGRDFHLFLQVIQPGIKSLAARVAQVAMPSDEDPSKPVHINIALGNPETDSRTPTLADGVLREKTLEDILYKAIADGQAKALGQGFTINSGANSEMFVQFNLNINFEPQVIAIIERSLFWLDGIDVDMRMKISQSRIDIDRAEPYLFAVEDKISNTIQTAARTKTDGVTTIAPLPPKDHERAGEATVSGSVLTVFTKAFFDVGEMDGRPTVPIESVTRQRTTL